jgi:pyruvate formate lyase activating enzyme
MEIRGLIPFSLNDYPGKMSCVIFVGHCNFRCPYCQNPHLVFDPESQPAVPIEEITAFLEKRKGRLDAVVVTGGEPSIHPDFESFAALVKRFGFLVKLDTNGSYPRRVSGWVRNGLVDFLGIDYKAPQARYREITQSLDPDPGKHVLSLIRFAVTEKIPHEIRTTVHRSLLASEDLATMRTELDEVGAGEWVLQQFHPVETIDDKLPETETYSDRELAELAASLPRTRVRGLKGIVHDVHET